MTDKYPLQPFRIHDHGALLRVIDEYPLALLLTGSASTDDFSLIPLLTGQRTATATTLLGHVDSNNPQAGELIVGRKVTFVFQAPNCYASPDIYPDEQLPGWLYVAVKGEGRISRAIVGEHAVEMLCEATARFGGPEQRFKLDKTDPRFDMFLSGIAGFEIEVTKLYGIAKLAQDKGANHSALASEHLNQHADSGLREILTAMRHASGS